MKRNFYLYILALVLCVGLSSCNKEKEYTCRFKIGYGNQHSSDSTLNMAIDNEEQEFLQACTELFKADKDRYFTIIANDKASLTAQVNDLCNQIEAKFNGRELLSHYTLQVGTITKGNKDDSEICSREFGPTIFGISDFGYESWQLKDFNDDIYYYNDIDKKITGLGVYTERDKSYLYFNGTFHWLLRLDLNEGCGGDSRYLYLYVAAMDAQSTWNTKPITHLIIFNNKGNKMSDNAMVVYENRIYHMISSIKNTNLDLNDDRCGTHLYLMYTTDDNDGWELRNIRGLNDNHYHYITQYIYESNGINRSEIVPLVEYDKNGNAHIVIDDEDGNVMGDCNKGYGGDYIYLQGRYVKKNN